MHLFALTSGRRWFLAAGAAAILALAPTLSPAQDEIPNAARLGYVSGNVSIEPAAVDTWGQAYPNLPLGPGDRIVTDGSGRAEIQIGQTYVRVGPNSDVTFVNDSPVAIVFGLAQGSLHIHAFGFWPNQSLQVNSPSGNSTIVNPGEYRADVIPNEGATIYTAFAAAEQVNWVNDQGPINRWVQKGWAIELVGSNPAMSYWLQPAPPDDLDNWSFARDQQIASAVSFRYVSPYIPGAYELDAAGDWQPGTPYGAVWFPRAVPGGWVPYRYGHWVNHAPWGWMWVEDESWGYAPFHYGRWVTVNGRWGWVPGPVSAQPVFAPAMVAFVGGVQFGGVGVSVWFPLGPGEPYRPWYPCPPHYVDTVNISNITETNVVHVQKTYVNIVNVTNVTNITYVNKTTAVTVVNHNDFASGKSVVQAVVKVQPEQIQQIQHATIAAAPEPKPTAASFVSRPAVHAPPVKAERPALINSEGKLAVAKPGAKPVPPPVKPVAAPKPLAGRTVVSEPPGAKSATPPPAAKAQPEPAKPAAQPASAQPKPAAPAAKPEAKPAAPPAKPEPKPAAEAAKPETKPGQPAAKPETKPGEKPAAKPEDKNKKPEPKKEEEKKPE